MHIFPRFVSAIRVITSRFDWFTELSPSFLIGQSNYFGFGFIRHSIETRSIRQIEQHINIVLLFFLTDDDGIWRRISTKREELLGKSSLWLNAKPPRSVYKVRFDLGSKLPVRIGKTKKSEKEDWQDTNDHTKTDLEVFSSDRLFYNRIDKHQRFLEERKAYIRDARQRRKSSSRLISTADSTAEKSKSNFQRARNPPFGLIASDTANALRMRANAVGTRDVVLKVETPTNEPPTNCGECRRLMKERDRFWGLESDSEEDCKIQTFNNRIKRRSSIIDLSTEQAGKKIAGCWSSFPWRSRSASRVKSSKLVGRGTWTGSVYVPPWQSKAAYRRRSNFLKPVQTVFDLEKARFGPKKGGFKVMSVLNGSFSMAKNPMTEVQKPKVLISFFTLIGHDLLMDSSLLHTAILL